MRRLQLTRAPRHRLLALLLPLVAACSGGDDADPGAPPAPLTQLAQDELPDSVAIAEPASAIGRLEVVEDLSEQVADRLLTFSDKLRRRDFTAAGVFLSPDFAGEALAGLAVAETTELPLGARATRYDAGSAPIVGRVDFLEGLRELMGPWARVETVLWKVKGAEFESGRGGYGKLKLYVHAIGQQPGGGAVSVAAWGYARAVRESGLYVLDRFDLDSLEVSERGGSMFTDVATAVGVAHTGVRFGQEGNTSYAFNGAASADLNGDGLWDLFVPSDGRNFLYLSRGDGTFSEEAEARGVAQPDAGTGAVFADFDNDGDADLLVGQTGWYDEETAPQGRALQLYVNDGEGRFTERGAEFGLADLRFAAYTLTVLDHDGDGWLDVFVCGYGRLEVEHNNSWIEATNGAPNGLLENQSGQGFVDVAGDLGMRGTSWSYASAAADFDQDGDVDLYVANDYGTNQLWRSRGDGSFEDVATALGVDDIGNGMGVAWGDLTSNGRLDLYVSNMSSTAGNRILARLGDELDPETHALLKKLAAGNSIFLQGADGTFERRPKDAGGLNGSWAWSPAICDLDLDGFLDVYLANGFVTGDQPFDT